MSGHLIANFSFLAATELRKHAFSIIEAGIKGVETKKALNRITRLDKDVLHVNGKKYHLKKYDEIFVIGIGKAALEAGRVLDSLLGSRITGGIILDVKKGRLKNIESIAGTHPFPSLSNMQATGKIMGILKHIKANDLLIAVVSGGGSALLSWPYAMKHEDMRYVIGSLMKKGARIKEINTVRKHLSEIQGGQFAKMAYPADIVGLIFSDVPGDDLSTVASGPIVLDPTTVQDARKVLKKYGLDKKMAEDVFRETPKDPKFFTKVYNVLVVSNTLAAEAMKEKALSLGYKAKIFSTVIEGEARKVGKKLARLPQKGEAVIAVGETTVKVRGKGKGGRNQELVLGGLPFVPEDGILVSCASDGIDNTMAAGALADACLRDIAKRKKMEVEKYLSNNDSFHFFEKTGGQIMTGVTGVNVSDLMLSMRQR